MRFWSLSLLLLATMACRPPRLAKRLPGTWRIDHYDEYDVATDRSTGHALDSAGVVIFGRNGTTARRLYEARPHGSLMPYAGYRWQLQDSVLTLSGTGGAAEQWLITRDLQYFLELVSVTPDRDTVRTMYLHK